MLNPSSYTQTQCYYYIRATAECKIRDSILRGIINVLRREMLVVLRERSRVPLQRLSTTKETLVRRRKWCVCVRRPLRTYPRGPLYFIRVQVIIILYPSCDV